MRMRTALALVMGATVVAIAGCEINLVDGEGDGGGGTTNTNTGDDPCKGVPTTGECVAGNKIRSCFMSGDFDTPPEVIEVQCQSNEKCGMGPNGAECQLQGDCYEGTSQCKDSSTLRTCDKGKWVESDCGSSSCVAQPGVGAQCLSYEGGTGIHLRGRLFYEFLAPNAALTDFDPTPVQEPAVAMFVTVHKGDDTIGMALTSIGDGSLQAGEFDVELSEEVDNTSIVVFWPIRFDDAGQPKMALAKAESDDAIYQQSSGYWYYPFDVCDEGGTCPVTDIGDLLVPTDFDSGAINIYQWFDYGMARFDGLFPTVNPLSYAVFWAPGNAFNCGNCFVPPVGGGGQVDYDKANGLSDHYQTSMCISGTTDSPTMWSKSVINHEFAHWSMASYTKSPGEGGPHYVDAASKPGLAYSEGYATFTGQSQISAGPADGDPIYFTKKSGTTFWVDISKNVWKSQGMGGTEALEKPNPNGPIDQDVNENLIASMLWSFWASAKAVAPQGLGEQPVYSTLRSQRLLGSQNRGYSTVDTIDYLDALKCEGNATDAQIDAVAESVSYPWDNKPLCP